MTHAALKDLIDAICDERIAAQRHSNIDSDDPRVFESAAALTAATKRTDGLVAALSAMEGEGEAVKEEYSESP